MIRNMKWLFSQSIRDKILKSRLTKSNANLPRVSQNL